MEIVAAARRPRDVTSRDVQSASVRMLAQGIQQAVLADPRRAHEVKQIRVFVQADNPAAASSESDHISSLLRLRQQSVSIGRFVYGRNRL